jgi:predicted RNase H-like nuclease (RuvC/YqgF family)
LTHYTKYQRNKRKQRKEDLERLEKENSLLLAEVQKLKLIIEQLKQKLSQQIKASQIVFENTVNLIQFLPHNSPYKRPFLY